MASIIAHELEEAVTDPDLNAWYDSRGYENADKCAWTFGTTYTAANGAEANMTLGGARLPHPAELGERERRLLRQELLAQGQWQTSTAGPHAPAVQPPLRHSAGRRQGAPSAFSGTHCPVSQ